MVETHYLERRIVREVASRKTAERLLEAKSLELFLKNEELELSSSKLREQFDLVAVIMDAVPDVLITCNENYEIETASRAANEVLHCTPEELVGQKLTELIPALGDKIVKLDQVEFVLSDIDITTGNDRTISIDLRGKRTRLYDRELIVMVLHEVSERKEAEQMKEEIRHQLNESRRLEAIGALSSGIAHELNTPIQFIGDNVKFVGTSLKKIHQSYIKYEYLKQKCSEEKLLNDHVRDIEKYNSEIDLNYLVEEIFTAMQETIEGIKQVRDIVVLMKEFAHPGTCDAELSDMNVTVQGALTICRSKTKGVVNIDTQLTTQDPQIYMRKGQIQQVLVNLIVNAVEAIEEIGQRDGCISIVTEIDDKNARIIISDNGPGVPAKLKEQIFDPFFTTKQVGKGTGQGLALAKDIIVKQHMGRLSLEDRDGFSTSFVVELPVEVKAAQDNAIATAQTSDDITPAQKIGQIS